MEINFISLMLTFAVIFLIVEVVRLNRQVAGLKLTVDKLTEQEDLRSLPKEREDVQVIRKAKEEFGLSLVEAQRSINKKNTEKSREI